ncbi:MAG: pilus assembly protein N-terminal domain-containing protein [Myxococcota bacterium]
MNLEELGWGVLCAYVALPLLSWSVREATQPFSRASALTLVLALSTVSFALPQLRSLSVAQGVALPASTAPLVASAVAAVQSAPYRLGFFEAVGGGWLLWVALGAMVALVRQRRGERLSVPPPWVRARVEGLAHELGLTAPGVGVAEAGGIPHLRGVWRPTVVVPRVALESLDEKAVGLVLRHELVHLSRGDHLRFALARWVEVLFPLYPAARTLTRRLRSACEDAVDERVFAHAPRDYPRVLVDMAELHRFGPAQPPLVAMAATELNRRIRMLTVSARRPPAQPWLALLICAAFTGSALLIPSTLLASNEESHDLQMMAGESRLLNLTSDISRIAVGNPDVVDVGIHERSAVSLHAKAAGKTTLLVWNKAGQRSVYQLSVAAKR